MRSFCCLPGVPAGGCEKRKGEPPGASAEHELDLHRWRWMVCWWWMVCWRWKERGMAALAAPAAPAALLPAAVISWL